MCFDILQDFSIKLISKMLASCARLELFVVIWCWCWCWCWCLFIVVVVAASFSYYFLFAVSSRTKDLLCDLASQANAPSEPRPHAEHGQQRPDASLLGKQVMGVGSGSSFGAAVRNSNHAAPWLQQTGFAAWRGGSYPDAARVHFLQHDHQLCIMQSMVDVIEQ